MKLSKKQIHNLSLELATHLDDIIAFFKLKLKKHRKMYVGKCPIHSNSDNETAFNLYHTGHSYIGNWVCRTHGCHEEFYGTPIGLIRGLLSKQQGWQHRGNKTVGFDYTIQWVLQFLNKEFEELSLDFEVGDTEAFITSVQAYNTNFARESNITREMVRRELDIPAEYYINRGYSIPILDRYDVGTCVKRGKEMTGRAVFPIYNDENRYIGCTGRSLYEKCILCGAYHSPNSKCPDKDIRYIYSKWRNSKDLEADRILFNLPSARPAINTNGIVILTEGPGDVLRLEDANIHISLSTLGAKLSPNQKRIIDKLKIFTILCLYDSDSAGISNVDEIMRLCQNQYRVIPLYLPDGKDVGDMAPRYLRELINPLIDKYKEAI